VVEVESVEPLELKGKSDPVPAYRLLAVRDVRDRPHGGLFVGRDRELTILEEAWRRVRPPAHQWAHGAERCLRDLLTRWPQDRVCLQPARGHSPPVGDERGRKQPTPDHPRAKYRRGKARLGDTPPNPLDPRARGGPASAHSRTFDKSC
jgi:hypothetical protein